MKKQIAILLFLFLGANIQAQDYLMVADVMPKFGNSGFNGIKKYINQHADYPPEAYFNKKEGEVNIRFIVKDDAQMVLMSPAYVKTLGFGLEESAMRAISSMPAWTPGVQDGKKANVWVFLPYSFKLPSEMPYFKERALNTKAKYLESDFHLLKYFQDSCALQNFDGIDTEKPVLLDLYIDTTGRVTKAMANEEDSSNPFLHGYAIKTALTLDGFTPATYKGRNVRSIKTIPVAYNTLLEEEIAQIEQTPKPKKELKVFVIVEQPTEYPGGKEAMFKFLSDNIKYPKEAKKNKVEGVVYIELTVDDKGKLVSSKPLMPVERQLGSGLEDEAIRVINIMPNWIPAKQAGVEVAYRFTIPIKFQL